VERIGPKVKGNRCLEKTQPVPLLDLELGSATFFLERTAARQNSFITAVRLGLHPTAA
jgi:hypothetical protein